MEFERAVQIFQSLSIVKVYHRGKEVWIDGLNSNDETAVVFVNDPYERQVIPVSELEEGEPIEKYQDTITYGPDRVLNEKE